MYLRESGQKKLYKVSKQTKSARDHTWHIADQACMTGIPTKAQIPGFRYAKLRTYLLYKLQLFIFRSLDTFNYKGKGTQPWCQPKHSGWASTGGPLCICMCTIALGRKRGRRLWVQEMDCWFGARKMYSTHYPVISCEDTVHWYGTRRQAQFHEVSSGQCKKNVKRESG